MTIGNYDPEAEVQSEAAKVFIQIGFIGVPMLCAVLTIILFTFFKFDKELPKLKEEYAAKEAKGSKSKKAKKA